MTQRWSRAEGTAMASSLQAQAFPPATLAFNLLPCFPHLPFFCHSFCIIHCWEKGTETRKEGQSFTPLHGQNLQEAWEQGQDFGPKPLPSRNPHSRSGTTQIRNTLLLLLPRSSWGQGAHLYNKAVNIHIISYVSLMGIAPIQSPWPKTSSAPNWNEGSGAKGLTCF